MTMDASPKTPKRGSRRWSLLSLTPLRSSLKHAPISPVEEAAATPEPAPVAAAAAALPPVVLEDSASEGEDDALDSFVRGLRTSTTCWDSPRPAGPRGPVASLAPESKRVLANVVALVWQRRTLADLHGGCCDGRLAAAERLLPDMDLPGLNFDPPRQQCGDGCIVGCVEELLETAHGVSKRFELACVAALHVVDLDPSRFEMRVKSAERASEKAEFDYGAKSPGPGCSWVFDALAGRVSVDDEGALVRVLAAVAATPGVAVVGLKNRFRSPTFLGYRDVLALLRFEHGAGSFVCELGLHLRPLLDFDRRHGCRDLYAAVWKSTMGGLSSLVTLDLAWCDRLQGTLEPLGGLGNLEALCLHFCVGLRGRLEPLAKLTKLRDLDLGCCMDLDGSLDPLGDLASLQRLNLRACAKLRGTLGPLGACENLKSLDIRDTFVTGSIARLFRPLHNLEVLDLKGTAVEDIGEFKRAHPNCRITGFSLSRRRYRATGESTAW